MADQARRSVDARLVQLDKEVDEVASRVKDAESQLLSCMDPAKEAKLQKIYDNLVQLLPLLLQERSNLERQLTGGGAGGSGAGILSISGAGEDALVDESGQYAGDLLPQPPVELPTSAQALAAYFADVGGIRVPVLRATYAKLILEDGSLREHLVVAPPCRLAIELDTTLFRRPNDAQSKLTTTIAVKTAFDAVWSMLRQYSTTGLQYTVALNCSERGTTSRAITKGSRPDLVVVANAATLFVGEDKKASLVDAMDDLVRKLAGGFSCHHYGPVQLYLAYTAAMPHFQLHSVDSAGAIANITPIFSFDLPAGRVGLVLALAKAYSLSAAMVEKLPHTSRRMALFEEVVRPYAVSHGDGTSMGNITPFVVTVETRPTCFVKKITHFETHYCEQRHTDLASITLAYEAATAAGNSIRYPYLVKAVLPPCLKRGGCYEVHTAPVGYNSSIMSSQELQDVAYTCCRAVQYLHDVGVVHRDIRWPNIVRIDDRHWMVVDLEDAAKAPCELPESYNLSGWDEDTCDPGQAPGTKVYSTLSDMQQIGKLLQPYLARLPGIPPAAHDFVRKLLGKELTAGEALQDAWLMPLQPSGQ